jgi:hypothetical protein
MSFNAHDIKAVRDLAKEVALICDTAIAVLETEGAGYQLYYENVKLSGRLRRRSMDLTRALAEMRRS